MSLMCNSQMNGRLACRKISRSLSATKSSRRFVNCPSNRPLLWLCCLPTATLAASTETRSARILDLLLLVSLIASALRPGKVLVTLFSISIILEWSKFASVSFSSRFSSRSFDAQLPLLKSGLYFSLRIFLHQAYKLRRFAVFWCSRLTMLAVSWAFHAR